MKKIISGILSILVVLCFSTVVFANEPAETVAEQEIIEIEIVIGEDDFVLMADNQVWWAETRYCDGYYPPLSIKVTAQTPGGTATGTLNRYKVVDHGRNNYTGYYNGMLTILGR